MDTYKKILIYSTVLGYLIVITDHLLTLKGLSLGFSEGNPFLISAAKYLSLSINQMLFINFFLALISVNIIYYTLDYFLEKDLPHVFIMFYVVYGFMILLRLVIVIEWFFILF